MLQTYLTVGSVWFQGADEGEQEHFTIITVSTIELQKGQFVDATDIMERLFFF